MDKQKQALEQQREPSQREVAEAIADMLGETEQAPRDAIYGMARQPEEGRL